MRIIVLASIVLAGCGPADNNMTTVLSYRGDPDNFTASGFPRHVYPIQDCDFEMRLDAPFEVSEGGYGDADVRVPLTFLDDRLVKSTAAGGVDAQSRVSYAFPSLYRGEGMREWFASGVNARTIEHPRPLENAASTLGTNETLKQDGTRGETHYLGTLPEGREIAMICTATDWPNPVCRAELPIGNNRQRYLIIFPPGAITKLPRMVEIGDGLFSEAAANCSPR
jgi:hypothetical protein